jgi:hypothetical protein
LRRRAHWGTHFWAQNWSQKWDPFRNISGAQTRSGTQVAAFLGWCQWLAVAVFKDNPPVLLNLDETSISRGMRPRRGHSLEARAPRRDRPYARISLREARGNATLVAVITSDPLVRRILPQVI